MVVTKDRDFRDNRLLISSPRRLLVVRTGNITNDALLKLFEVHLDAIVNTLSNADSPNWARTPWVLHRRRDETAR